ncbi:hypothetical protein V1507DRAFT_453582 [Lipomyces tetrasporus]
MLRLHSLSRALAWFLMLLKVLQGSKMKPDLLMSHRFKLSEIESANDIFGNPSTAQAIKMYIEADGL